MNVYGAEEPFLCARVCKYKEKAQIFHKAWLAEKKNLKW